MSEKIISVKNLGFGFGKRQILKNVTFDITEGDILAIIGPNGAGKTMLVRSILGLNDNYTGDIVWHKKPETGYVPQKISLKKVFL